EQLATLEHKVLPSSEIGESNRTWIQSAAQRATPVDKHSSRREDWPADRDTLPIRTGRPLADSQLSPAEPAQGQYERHHAPGSHDADSPPLLADRRAFEHHRPQRFDQRRERQQLDRRLNRLRKPLRRKEDAREDPH